MTTATESASSLPRLELSTVQVARPARKLGALALAALPGAATIYLSFNSGGYFAGAQGTVAAGLALIVAVRMAVIRDPFGGFSRPLRVAVAALAAYALWALVSSHWSHSPARAILDFDLACVYLFALILFGSSVRSHRRVRWTVGLTWFSMLAVCIAALATRLRPDLFPIPANLSPNRLAFPLTYWNALGLFAVIGITLGLHLASSTREAKLMRVVAAAAIPVFAVTILLTFSRASLVLGAGGLLAYALLARPRGLLSTLLAAGPTTALAVADTYQAKLVANADTTAAAVQQGRHLTTTILLACLAAALVRAALLELDTRLAKFGVSSTRHHNARILLAFFCAVAVLVGVFGFGGQIAHQWRNFTRQDSSSNDVRNRINNFSIGSRLPGWRIAIKSFDGAPLRGRGAGTFAIDFDQRRPNGGVALETHSIYLEAMSELGIVGLVTIVISLLALIGSCFIRARRSERSLWIVLGVVGLLWAAHAGVDWDWEMPAVTLPVFVLTACALARRGGGVHLRPKVELALRVGVGLIALAVAVTALRVSVSDNHLSGAVTEFNSGNCPTAVADARAAITTLPSRPQPYSIIGYCDVLNQRPQLAVAEMQRAVTRDPQNWRYRYGLAVVQAAAGRDPRPELHMSQALNPIEPMIVTAAGTFSTRNRRHWRQSALTLPMPVSMRE